MWKIGQPEYKTTDTGCLHCHRPGCSRRIHLQESVGNLASGIRVERFPTEEASDLHMDVDLLVFRAEHMRRRGLVQPSKHVSGET